MCPYVLLASDMDAYELHVSGIVPLLQQYAHVTGTMLRTWAGFGGVTFVRWLTTLTEQRGLSHLTKPSAVPQPPAAKHRHAVLQHGGHSNRCRVVCEWTWRRRRRRRLVVVAVVVVVALTPLSSSLVAGRVVDFCAFVGEADELGHSGATLQRHLAGDVHNRQRRVRELVEVLCQQLHALA